MFHGRWFSDHHGLESCLSRVQGTSSTKLLYFSVFRTSTGGVFRAMDGYGYGYSGERAVYKVGMLHATRSYVHISLYVLTEVRHHEQQNTE